MTLAEMEAMLRSRVGNPTESDISKPMMYEQINLAYHDLCDRFKFRETMARLRFDTDSTHNIYGLPVSWYEVKRVRYADDDDRGGRLEKLGPNSTYDIDQDQTPGRPCAYALWGNEIQLYPPPDGVYRIEIFGRFQPNRLQAATDIPIVPLPWHMGIVFLARWYYWDGGGVQNFQAANVALQAFTTWATGRPTPTIRELDDSEQAVTVPELGRYSSRRRGDMSPEMWRTGGM